MSTISTLIRNGHIAQLVRSTRAEQINTATEPSPPNTPYWLLWSTGIVACALCVIAFVLWGINGAITLFDMIVALCT